MWRGDGGLRQVSEKARGTLEKRRKKRPDADAKISIKIQGAGATGGCQRTGRAADH